MWPMSGLSLVCWKKKVFGGKIKWCEKKNPGKDRGQRTQINFTTKRSCSLHMMSYTELITEKSGSP